MKLVQQFKFLHDKVTAEESFRQPGLKELDLQQGQLSWILYIPEN